MNASAAALLLIVGSGCATATTAVHGEATRSRASLELQMPKRVGRQDQLRAVLRNDGPGPLWVNAVIALNRPGDGELWLEVADGSETIEFEGFVDLRDVIASDYKLLQPNEFATGGATLTWFPDLKAGRRYTVRAHYKDRNKKPPPAPRGSRYVGEEVISPPVQFEFVE